MKDSKRHIHIRHMYLNMKKKKKKMEVVTCRMTLYFNLGGKEQAEIMI